MKGTTLVILIFLTIIVAIGWFSFFSDTQAAEQADPAKAYQANIQQADEWAEEGLYQRAILKYKDAISVEPTEEIYKKMLDAYEKRYAEDTGIRSEYVSA